MLRAVAENSDVKSKQDENTLLKHQNNVLVVRLREAVEDAAVDELLADHPYNPTVVDNAPNAREEQSEVVIYKKRKSLAQTREVAIRVDATDVIDADYALPKKVIVA